MAYCLNALGRGGGGFDNEGKTAANWGKEFGALKGGSVTPTSYESNYREPLESLPVKPLTEDLLIAHILKRSQPNTWKRNNDCMVFKQVAKHAGLVVDFSTIKGKYKPTPLSPDDVPSDQEIEAIWASIDSPGWRWVYGMLTTYGLRPHCPSGSGLSTPGGQITTPTLRAGPGGLFGVIVFRVLAASLQTPIAPHRETPELRLRHPAK